LAPATRLVPGLALVVVIGVVAAIGQALEERRFGHAVIEALVLAILIGVAVRNLRPLPASAQPGVRFAAKQVLEFAIVLLGASIDAGSLVAAGPTLLAAIVVAVVVGITASFAIGRALGLNQRLAILVAVGNSICGNSAIAAVAPVIDASAADVASSIALTAVLGVAIVLLLPLLIPVLGFTFHQYGVLAGMTVYAVPQVLAATFPVSTASAQIATLVKLVRVLLLGPVVLFFSVFHPAGARPGAASRLSISRFVPWFLVGFVVMAALRSLGVLPTAIADLLREVSRWLTVGAMAALGLGVEIRAVRTVGRPVLLTVAASLGVMVVTAVTLIRVVGV
jgi:uncharacterized integral membrane protein (TIGR00698 family)